MSRVYDMLMKSGKFTAAQNKAEKGDYVDSISELVAICEKDGFIPRAYVETPLDKVDRTIQDFQAYTRQLVTEESGLSELIENAIQQIKSDKEKEAAISSEAADDDEVFEETLFSGQEKEKITDADFKELFDLEAEAAEADDAYLKDLLAKGEI